MTESPTSWVEIIWTRGLRIVVILVIAIALARLLKALTSRLVEISKVHTRVGHMREQQTRTMAGLVVQRRSGRDFCRRDSDGSA